MAMSGLLRRVVGKNFDIFLYNGSLGCQVQQTRATQSFVVIDKPKPGVKGKSYRRFVHFEDKYTVKPLQVTNLAGRDPITGKNIFFSQLFFLFPNYYIPQLKFSIY